MTFPPGLEKFYLYGMIIRIIVLQIEKTGSHGEPITGFALAVFFARNKNKYMHSSELL